MHPLSSVASVAKVYTFAFVIFLNNPVKIGEVKENIKLRIKSEKSMLDIKMPRPIPFHISRYLLCTIHFYPHWLILLKSNFNSVKYHVVHTMTMYYIGRTKMTLQGQIIGNDKAMH